MSGHSKWSKVKHQKKTTDSIKAQAFTKASRAITIAVREGGGVTDPIHNFKLRLAIEKAHEANVPKENITRAIEKGTGQGVNDLAYVMYEAYGPGGVACLIETTTDNKQRTVSLIKNILEQNGGSITSPGAVSYLFNRCCVCTVPKGTYTLDEMLEKALEIAVDDVVETEDMFELYTSAHNASLLKDMLTQKGIVIDNIELIMNPKVSIALTQKDAERIEQLVEQLEESEDVQKVYTNLQS